MDSITDQSARPDELNEEFEIDPTPIWPTEDGRLEPIFLGGLPWVEFEEFEPPTQGTAEAPLPQWLQGSSAGLILQVIYPDGL